MKVVLVISSMSPGGAERVMSIMANYWVERGWDVMLITLEGDTEPFYFLNPQIRQKKLSLYWPSANLFSSIASNLKRLKILRSAIRKSNPDIVISFIDMTNVRVVMSLLFSGVPVIISERTDPANRHKISTLGRLLCKLTYPLTSRLVVQSKAAKLFFPFYMGRQIVVIPNPVIAPTKKNTNVDLPSPLVMTVGRQSKEKDHALLIRAFAGLPHELASWNLVLIGDGPRHDNLKQLALDLGIANKVVFTGIVEGIGDHLSKADIFVLPSRFEGFPNALCEAISSGVASISTNFAAASEIIEHGENGLIVPSQDTDAMTLALVRLMTDTTLRQNFSERGKDLSQRFSTKSVMNTWEELISKTVNTRTPL